MIRRPWGACWMVSVTERVKTLFFSPLQPRKGGGGGRAGRGGIPCPLPSRPPPPRQPFQPSPTPSPALPGWLSKFLGPGPNRAPRAKALEAPAPKPVQAP